MTNGIAKLWSIECIDLELDLILLSAGSKKASDWIFCHLKQYKKKSTWPWEATILFACNKHDNTGEFNQVLRHIGHSIFYFAMMTSKWSVLVKIESNWLKTLATNKNSIRYFIRKQSIKLVRPPYDEYFSSFEVQ